MMTFPRYGKMNIMFQSTNQKMIGLVEKNGASGAKVGTKSQSCHYVS
jgi:hypothetical protein